MTAYSYHRKQGVKEQKVGGELMLIDESVDKVHVLNATSAFIWTCLGETTDAARIEERLREAFESGVEDFGAVVGKALSQFVEKGIVTRDASVT